MTKQHVTTLVLLELSAAFDKVDRDILLKRLSSKLGLNDSTLGWFQSYLSGSSQRISVRSSMQAHFLMSPESTFLLHVHCYAGDTRLYVSFSPIEQPGQADEFAAIERCTQDIRKWMSQHKLLMNDV